MRNATTQSSETLKQGLSERLIGVRGTLQMTQKEMAAILDLGKNTWQNYETGGQVPGGAVLAKLSELGFNANWILTGQGEPYHHDPESAGICEAPADYTARAGIEPVFIRNAVRLVERRLGQDADLETKAHLVADVAADLQKMHDEEWASAPESP